MFTIQAVIHPANAAITLSRIVNNSPLQPVDGPYLSSITADHPLRPAKDYKAWYAVNTPTTAILSKIYLKAIQIFSY